MISRLVKYYGIFLSAYIAVRLLVTGSFSVLPSTNNAVTLLFLTAIVVIAIFVSEWPEFKLVSALTIITYSLDRIGDLWVYAKLNALIANETTKMIIFAVMIIVVVALATNQATLDYFIIKDKIAEKKSQNENSGSSLI